MTRFVAKTCILSTSGCALGVSGPCHSLLCAMPSASLAIRPATPSDVPLILQLIKDLAEYERDPGAVDATYVSLHEALFERGAGPGTPRGCEVLIGEVDGVPQGFAMFFHNFSSWRGRSGLYLEDLFVRPACRGVGLGEALLRACAKIAVERGCPRMEWIVIDWNTPAIGFYERLGAKPLSEWTVFRLDGKTLAQVALGK
jgi:ribosomal protein S18 acetylase RimI-like enzyme